MKTQNLMKFDMKLGGGFDWDDVIMEIYLWILGGFSNDDEWWREGGGG